MSDLHLDDTLKSIRETLCVASTAVNHVPEYASRAAWDTALIGRIIAEIDQQRPLAADGKHGDLHTPTCGCEDKPTMGRLVGGCTCGHNIAVHGGWGCSTGCGCEVPMSRLLGREAKEPS